MVAPSGSQSPTSEECLSAHLAALRVPVPNYFGKVVDVFKLANGSAGRSCNLFQLRPALINRIVGIVEERRH